MLELKNSQSISLEKLPILAWSDFQKFVISQTKAGLRVAAFFAVPIISTDAKIPSARLYCVLLDDTKSLIHPVACDVIQEFPSLTPECPQVHLFEREIWEQTGIIPSNHPCLKPVRFPRKAGGARGKSQVGIMNYFQVEGEEIHEVGVGPVHAGVIEPGHFRFQCHGENVFHLEISLGYQHRGIEKQLLGGPHRKTMSQMEAVAGDTTIGHGLAYCQLLEGLAHMQVSPRTHALRSIMLELERLANHTGDIGALAGDVAFLPTASACGALRGDFLNISAIICGSRLGRAFLKPGGAYFDVDTNRIADVRNRLAKTFLGTKRTTELLLDTPSVLSRFENTGKLTLHTAGEIGLVGPAARACGLTRDIRHDHSFAYYGTKSIAIARGDAGDVFSRANMRWLEVQNSVDYITQTLNSLPEGSISSGVLSSFAGKQFIVSLTEGWRGEICHVAITNEHGKFAHYKIVDPSFHNWFGLALALRGNAIFDFPLCNKSFNLSYCGFDL